MVKVDKKKKKLVVKKVEDFKKIKQKVGRKLKRLNETIPLVKTSKVLLKSQFTEKQVKLELHSLRNKVKDETLTISRINELHGTITSTLRKCQTSRGSERRDSLILARELLKSVGGQIFVRSSSAILESVCPLMADSDHEVRVEASKLFSMVMSQDLNLNISCLTSPIISSNLFRALSNPISSDDAPFFVDILLNCNHHFVMSISAKLVQSLLNMLQKQTSIKSQSSIYIRKSNHLNLPSQSKRNKIEAIERLSRIFKILSEQTQDHRYLYFYRLYSDNALDDDEKCLKLTTNSIQAFSEVLNDILVPDYENHFCFDSLTCKLLLQALSAIDAVLKFAKTVFRSLTQYDACLKQCGSSYLTNVFTRLPANVFEKISKRGKWTGQEKDISHAVNSLVASIKANF